MPQTVLSLAKTTQPTLSMVVQRGRLFERMEPGHGHRAVWVSGPPGAGKTTCVASYLQASGKRALWYQLDSSDADAATFLFYLRQSAIKHSRQSSLALPELPATGADWHDFGRRLFRAIFERFAEPVVFVFDNFEAVTPPSELHAVMASMLEEVPAGSLLLFASREAPAPAFARATANRVLARMEGDELALSADEFRELAKLRGLKLADADLERIIERSAGWVTGAILMLELARRPQAAVATQPSASGALLFDYIAQEVFAGFDPVLRAFLLKVCWARRLGLRLAEALGDEPGARQVLSNLSRNNYFVTERFDSQECEYILHPLLREFLQAQARRLLGDTEVAALQRKAALLLAGESQIEEAVELLAENLDWQPLEDIIRQHADLLVRQGRHALLATWIEELPPDRLNADAWLLYWLGAARLHQSPREARRCFESALRRFSVRHDGAGNGPLRACRGAIEAILLEMDDLSLLDSWIEAMRVQLARNREADGAAAAETMLLAAVALRNPAHEDLAGNLHGCEQKILREAGSRDQVENCLWLIQSYLLCGELGRAGELLGLVQGNPALPQDGTMPVRLSLLAALHALLCGDGEAARSFSRGCLAAPDRPPEHLRPLIGACESAAAITLGPAKDGGEIADSPGAGIPGQNRLSRFFRHYLASWRGLIAGETIAALHEQRLAQSCAAELGIPFLEVLSGSAYAQLLFRCNDTRGGTAQLRRVHSQARDLHNPLLEFMTLLIYAEVAMQKGRTSSGSNALRYALGLGRRHGYYHVPWWHSAQLADLLALALQHGIETEYVRDFVLRRSLQPTRPPVDVPDWPWPLRITTLGGLSIVDASNHEISADRIKGRPLQVLKVLLALGGREVPAEQVATALWPHVDSDYSDKSLTINLHRLRRLLGHDDAILLRDGRLSVNAALVWMDLFALETTIAGIASGRGTPAGAAPEAAANVARLSELCRGPFLPGDADLPCFAQRRELCRKAIEGLPGDAVSNESRVVFDRLTAALTLPA